MGATEAERLMKGCIQLRSQLAAANQAREKAEADLAEAKANCPACSDREAMRLATVKERDDMTAERDALLDLLQDAFFEMGYLVPEGPLLGWHDTCALSTCRDVGEVLVEAGRLERHPDGCGRVRF